MSFKALVVAAALLGLAACGSSNDNTQPTAAPAPSSSPTTTSQAAPPIKEPTWDRLIKRAQACAPKALMYVQMSTTRPQQVAMIAVTSDDRLQHISVHPEHDGERQVHDAHRRQQGVRR